MKDVSKLVALDIGGVCVELHFARALARLGLSSFAMLGTRFHELNRALETGACGEAEFWRGMEELFGGRFSQSELAEIWSSIIGDAFPGMGEAIRSRHGRYRFVFFSNTSVCHMRTVFERIGSFSDCIEGGVYSYEAGCIKPEPEIYELFEEKYGVPDFYFDDNRDNVAGAKKRGWNAFVFTSAKDFASILGD